IRAANRPLPVPRPGGGRSWAGTLHRAGAAFELPTRPRPSAGGYLPEGDGEARRRALRHDDGVGIGVWRVFALPRAPFRRVIFHEPARTAARVERCAATRPWGIE